MAETRTEIQFRQEARKYVDAQLEVMERYGNKAILSPAEYSGLVSDVAAIGRKIWIASGGKIEEVSRD